MLTVPCSLYCNWVSISADVLELECYTGKPRMYDETHQVQITLITKCGLYVHALFALLYLGANISRPTRIRCYTGKSRMYDETQKI